MNMNNAVFRPRIRGRSRPFRSLLFAVAGALILTGVLAPRANATCLDCPPELLQETPIVYFNFETSGTGLTSVGNFDGYTTLQSSTIVNGPTNPFPIATSGSNTGHFGVIATFGPSPQNQTVAGTIDGQLANDPTTADPNHALDLNGNTTSSQPMFCFTFGLNTTGYTNLCLNFELKSIGSGQFTGVEVFTSTNGGTTFTATPEGLVSINQDGSYHPYSFDISGAAGSANAVIEICLSGSTNSSNGNHTLIDNIVVNSETCVPEPSTYIGGLLGIVGLCWYQRRRIRVILPRCGFRGLGRA
jgi:hypothetical protein